MGGVEVIWSSGLSCAQCDREDRCAWQVERRGRKDCGQSETRITGGGLCPPARGRTTSAGLVSLRGRRAQHEYEPVHTPSITFHQQVRPRIVGEASELLVATTTRAARMSACQRRLLGPRWTSRTPQEVVVGSGSGHPWSIWRVPPLPLPAAAHRCRLCTNRCCWGPIHAAAG